MRPRAVAGAQAVSLAAIQAEGPSITSPSRRQAIDLMTQVKARFEALLRLNWAPDQVDKAFDIAVMPVVVAAENARNPDLRLTFLESPDELKDWLALEAPGGERRRAVFNLPGFEEHSMVADVRRVDGRTSVLLVEPLDPNNDLATKYDTAVLPAFRSLNLLPRRAVLSALALGTQKSDTGCRIFALSFASKLAGLKAEVDLIHEQNQAGAPLSTSIGFPLQKWAGTRDRRMFSGTALMPQPFMKHAQSSDTLKDWHAAHPKVPLDNPVNHKGQTLLGRQEKHAVTRLPVNRGEQQGNAQPRKTGPMTYSRSIEEKRVTYMDRAIEYLRHAPESECQDFLGRLQRAGITEHAIQDLGLKSRKWGPLPPAGDSTAAMPV